MLQARILRSPEGEAGGGGGDRFEAAGEAAIAALGEHTSMSEEPSGSPPQEATPEAEPQQQTGAEPQQQAEAPADEFSYEYEEGGQKYKLGRQEVNYLLQRGVQMARIEQELRSRPPQPAPKAQPQAAPAGQQPQAGQQPNPELQAVNTRVQQLEQALEQQRIAAARAELAAEAEREFEANPDLRSIASQNPALRTRVLGMMHFLHGTEGISYKDAAKAWAGVFGGVKTAGQAQLVQQKIGAARQQVEGGGGGTPAGKPKQFAAKNLWDDSIDKAAERFLAQAADERT